MTLRSDFPGFPELKETFLNLLAEEGGSGSRMHLSQVYDRLAEHFGLTAADQRVTYYEVYGEGEDRSYWHNLVRTAKARLIDDGLLLQGVGHGVCQLSPPEAERRTRRTRTQGEGEAFASPLSSTIVAEPPARSFSVVERIIRDTALAKEVKEDMGYECQLCELTLYVSGFQPYAESHHVKPLGAPHNGPDIRGNILCVCPNCHVRLDYGAVTLDPERFPNVDAEYISYHNDVIAKPPAA